MTERECLNNIQDLRMVRDVYLRLLHDPTSSFYKNDIVKTLLEKTSKELDRLEELLYNGELSNSYELMGIKL